MKRMLKIVGIIFSDHCAYLKAGGSRRLYKVQTSGEIETKYPAVLKHLASWGFIVMATEEENSWNGFSSEMCLRTIIKFNETETIEGWESNPFYGRVNIDNIGVSGHSQGGVGVINAATENKHG